MATPSGFGSGFFVGQSQIATNFHIVEGAAKGTAKLADSPTKYTVNGISATDEKNDLAILKVTGFEGEPLPLGDSDTVKTDETVYVAGNPKGLEGKFSNDTINNLHDGDAKKRFQMTALISPGSSGGPVLNGNGEVIGISLITLEDGQNLNFAIPSNRSQGIARSVREGETFVAGQTIHIRRNASQVGLCQVQIRSISGLPLMIMMSLSTSSPITPLPTTFGEL